MSTVNLHTNNNNSFRPIQPAYTSQEDRVAALVQKIKASLLFTEMHNDIVQITASYLPREESYLPREREEGNEGLHAILKNTFSAYAAPLTIDERLSCKTSLSWEEIFPNSDRSSCEDRSQALVELVKACPELRSLDLYSSTINDADLEKIIKATPKMSHLSVKGCAYLTHKGFAFVLNHNPSSLVSLDLSSLFRLQTVGTLLAKFTNLDTLNLSHCRNLKEIPSLPPNLRTLNVAYCDRLERINFVLTLQSLNLNGCPFQNIDAIPTLVNLHTLSWGDCPSKEVQAVMGTLLVKLINLQNLDLRDCRGLEDTSFLSHLTSLQTLRLAGCPINDTRTLPISLQNLDLTNCPVKDISDASRLINLRSLRLNYCPVEDISAISTLVNLESLEAVNCPIKDTGPVLALIEQQKKLGLKPVKFKQAEIYFRK